jgi:hypothetical protein
LVQSHPHDPIINHWLSWRPGASHLITIGRDKILGIGDRSFLHEEVITLLNKKQLTTLAQASMARDPVTFAEVWRSDEDLELTGIHATDWYNYTVELNRAGVTLHEGAKIHSFGLVAIHLETLLSKTAMMLSYLLRISRRGTGWKVNIWKWHLQLKIILFFWLAMDNRILTWDILQKKGWVGPSICHLCKQNFEDNTHLFIQCSFAILFGKNVHTSLIIISHGPA